MVRHGASGGSLALDRKPAYRECYDFRLDFFVELDTRRLYLLHVFVTRLFPEEAKEARYEFLDLCDFDVYGISPAGRIQAICEYLKDFAVPYLLRYADAVVLKRDWEAGTLKERGLSGEGRDFLAAVSPDGEFGAAWRPKALPSATVASSKETDEFIDLIPPVVLGETFLISGPPALQKCDTFPANGHVHPDVDLPGGAGSQEVKYFSRDADHIHGTEYPVRIYVIASGQVYLLNTAGPASSSPLETLPIGWLYASLLNHRLLLGDSDGGVYVSSESGLAVTVEDFPTKGPLMPFKETRGRIRMKMVEEGSGDLKTVAMDLGTGAWKRVYK